MPNTELFALDVDLFIQLISSFEGRQLYPKEESKKESLENSTRELRDKSGVDLIPDGVYTFETNLLKFGKAKGIMVVEYDKLILKKGSLCAPFTHKNPPSILKTARFDNRVLQNDLICNSPSMATRIVRGKNQNGWLSWKNKDGEVIDIYRNKKVD